MGAEKSLCGSAISPNSCLGLARRDLCRRRIKSMVKSMAERCAPATPITIIAKNQFHSVTSTALVAQPNDLPAATVNNSFNVGGI